MNKVKIDTRCHRHSNALTGQSAWVPVKTSATNIMFLTLHYYFLVTAVTSIFDKSVNIRSSTATHDILFQTSHSIIQCGDDILQSAP